MAHGSISEVKKFWEQASCGEELYLEGHDRDDYERQSRERYRLEPEILRFAEFERHRDRDVLEIGVGLGADHQRFAEAGAKLTGIDLTERAVAHVRRRFDLLGLQSDLHRRGPSSDSRSVCVVEPPRCSVPVPDLSLIAGR